ncbi:glycosyltransferase [Yersinia sp. 2466 StPb PI]|uniref:glycosyltransferase n=1 Tax=unclassified Yersinia (in: enterobacteria) TaxID=2653513 RepID=UPI00355B4200
MDNKKILSLIIPVYNAGKYLESCLISVFSQWDNMLEVIIINDGSTDNSADIISKYSKIYDFKYLSQDNSGVSVVRNKGVEIATGDYIVFVDADDIWCDKIYSSIKKIIIKNAPDCILFNYIELTEGKENKFDLINKNEFTKSNLESVKIGIANSEMFYLWRCVFNKNIFDNIIFDVGRRFEDQLIFPILISKCESIYESKDYIVKYRQNPDSITKNLNVSDLDDSEVGLLRFKDQYIKYHSRYWTAIIASVFVSHISKCARIYHIDKKTALRSYRKSFEIISLRPIISSGNIKSILYYIFSDIMFYRLVSAVKNEVKK